MVAPLGRFSLRVTAEYLLCPHLSVIYSTLAMFFCPFSGRYFLSQCAVFVQFGLANSFLERHRLRVNHPFENGFELVVGNIISSGDQRCLLNWIGEEQRCRYQIINSNAPAVPSLTPIGTKLMMRIETQNYFLLSMLERKRWMRSDCLI
jgi:hypothetical protein